MDLKYEAKWEEIQKRFKSLVKKYHLIKTSVVKNLKINLKKNYTGL